MHDVEMMKAVAGTIERALSAEGREWLTRREIASMLACSIEDTGEPLGLLLHYGRLESKATSGATLYRKTRVRGAAARRELGIPLWTSWRHISKFGSGYLCFGRVILEFNWTARPARQWLRQLRAGRSAERVYPWGRGPGFHTLHFAWGPLVFFARRWRS